MDINIHDAISVGFRQVENCVIIEVETVNNGAQEVSIFWVVESDRVVVMSPKGV